MILIALTVAASFVSLVLLARHRGSGRDYGGVLFGTGWRFEIVLQSPLQLDAAGVAAATAAASSQ